MLLCSRFIKDIIHLFNSILHAQLKGDFEIRILYFQGQTPKQQRKRQETQSFQNRYIFCDLGDKIGKGGFATVFKAIEIYTGIEVAVKVVNL